MSSLWLFRKGNDTSTRGGVRERIMVNKDIEKLLPLWESYKMDGAINLSHSQRIVIEIEHKRLYGVGFCKTCDEHTATAFNRVMTQYISGR